LGYIKINLKTASFITKRQKWSWPCPIILHRTGHCKGRFSGIYCR